MTSEQGEAIAVSSLKLPALSVLHLRSISLADILPVRMNSQYPTSVVFSKEITILVNSYSLVLVLTVASVR